MKLGSAWSPSCSGLVKTLPRREQVAAAARQDPAAILTAAEDDLVAWLSDKRVPTVGSERVQRVASAR